MFYLIDKKVWMPSFDIIRKLRKKLNIKKMGHIWTLDPLASGLVLVATEQSTKLLSYLNSNKKTYKFSVKINWTTASLDLEEEIIFHSTENYQAKSNEELKKFLQNQKTQIPPQFSAINIDWKRAYKLARKEKNFVIPERQINVENVEILQNSIEEVEVRLTISSGWYIRSFAPIIGQFLWTSGWYISALRREKLYIWENFLSEELSQDIDNFDANKNISEQILFPDFSFISSQNNELLKKIKNWDNFDIPEIQKIEWKKYILTFENYSSLIQFTNGKFKILRNDVLSNSHKIHTK